ncbi:hypothetical protein K7957_02025 [Sphingomonas yunnanensis]|uniref:hypothetical protein n=1 Tax=Sphingomonas yunnanensis TaxID=310400 RepID=UPI001CA6E4BF|nr:hypothetical protein [Sphingomonas yunnanensis]MBY9061709.1 hypothetical protein [Sphingomonas yunnanensis]
MLNVMTFAIFAGALSTAGYAMHATLAPNLDKILSALRGEMAPARAAPLAALVRAERRIAVRRWAGSATPALTPLRQRGAA